MEWSWRTVLILIALVVIAAILVDGFRRMRRARAEALRLDVSHDFKFPEGDHNPELPSGGFRVVGQQRNAAAEPAKEKTRPVVSQQEPRFEAEAFGGDEFLSPARTVSKSAAAPAAEASVAETTVAETSDAEAEDTEALSAEPLPEDMPALSTADEQDDIFQPAAEDDEEPLIPWQDDVGAARVISREEAEHHKAGPVAEKVQDLEIPRSPLIPKARPVNLDEAVPVLLDVEELGAEEADPVYEDTAENTQPDTQAATSADDVIAEATADDASAIDDRAEEMNGEETDVVDPHLEQEVDDIPAGLVSQPVNFAGPGAESLDSRPVPELVLEIHCVAHDHDGFSGKDVLFLFNSCDLRFGEKKIFHRFEQPDGEGCIQFSVAQSFEPGTFEPAAMAQQHFRGLSFFMSMPGAKRPLEAYEAMSEMALLIARKLRADLYDGARSALTPQTIEHDRQQIMDFERRQKLASKKQARR